MDVLVGVRIRTPLVCRVTSGMWRIVSCWLLWVYLAFCWGALAIFRVLVARAPGGKFVVAKRVK